MTDAGSAGPSMDDDAASQQLMNEARAAHPNRDDASSPVNGSKNVSSSERKKRKRHSAHKSPREQPASSFATSQGVLSQEATLQSSLPIDSQTQMHAEVSGDSNAPVVQIPDSQTLPHTTSTPMSPIIASSSIVPASLTKSRRTYKKNRRSILPESGDGEAVSDKDDDGDTAMGADVAASPLHKPSKRKRSRTSNTEPESPKQGELEAEEDTNAAQAREHVADEVAGTPTPAKRERKFKHKRASEANHNHKSAQQPEKKKQKKDKKSKPRSDAEAAPEDEIPATNGRARAAEVDQEHVPDSDDDAKVTFANSTAISDEAATNEEGLKDTSTRKKCGKSMKEQKNPEHRQSFEGPANATEEADNNNDDDPDDIYCEPKSSSDEDEVPHERSVNSKSSSKKIRKRRTQSSDTPSKGARKQRKPSDRPARIRKSKISSTNVVTSAEKALNANRDLSHPPILRQEGDFSQDEEELIRRAIRDYQERKGLDTPELVDIIQWTTDDVDRTNVSSKSDWSLQEKEDANESSEFWAEMKLINLTRKFDIIRRHIRTQYHQYKSGGWTEEGDEQLRKLHALHPNRWKIISTSMGDRSMHDCQNRWRDYLQYGNKRNVATWSKDEEELLIGAVNTVAQRDEDARAETGRPPLDEYTNKDISWPQVSREMGGIRSRIQASVKWSKMKDRVNPPRIQVEHKPRKEVVQPPAPTSTLKKRGRPRKNEIVEGEQPQKRRKSEEEQDTASDREQVKEGESEGAHSMLWGDKFDLIYAIADLRDDSQEDIDWDAVAKAQKHPWSKQTLRAALQELIQLARDSGKDVDEEDFPGTVDDIMDFIMSEHAEELEEHYDAEKVAPKDEVHTAKSLAATSIGTKKRRKKDRTDRDSTQTGPSSDKKQKKKRRSNVKTEALGSPKSKEVISDSDDAGCKSEL